MSKKKDGYDFGCEIRNAAAIVSGLGCLFSGGCDRPTDEYMRKSLSGVTEYLERIAADLEEL